MLLVSWAAWVQSGLSLGRRPLQGCSLELLPQRFVWIIARDLQLEKTESMHQRRRADAPSLPDLSPGPLREPLWDPQATGARPRTGSSKILDWDVRWWTHAGWATGLGVVASRSHAQVVLSIVRSCRVQRARPPRVTALIS